MSYFLRRSIPFWPKCSRRSYMKSWLNMYMVDQGVIETPSRSLILRHAKILVEQTVRFAVVNVLEISQNIRFKAIFSLSDAFSILSWVAIPLKHIKRLESLKISLEKYIASPLIRRFWVKYTAFLKPLYSAFILYTLAQWLSITLGFWSNGHILEPCGRC